VLGRCQRGDTIAEGYILNTSTYSSFPTWSALREFVLVWNLVM